MTEYKYECVGMRTVVKSDKDTDSKEKQWTKPYFEPILFKCFLLAKLTAVFEQVWTFDETVYEHCNKVKINCENIDFEWESSASVAHHSNFDRQVDGTR